MAVGKVGIGVRRGLELIEMLEPRHLLSAAAPRVVLGDLAVPSIECNSTICIPGKRISVAVTVKNTGKATLNIGKLVRAEIRMSQDKLWGNSDDVLLSSFSLRGTWRAKYTWEFMRNVIVPVNAGDGSYYLGVTVDPKRMLKETSTTNNRRWLSPQPTLVVNGWDSAVISIQYAGVFTVAAGTRMGAECVVANCGRNTIGTQDLLADIHMSQDRIWGNADDVQIGQFTNSGDLNTANEAAEPIYLQVPPGMATGQYFIGAQASIMGAVEPNTVNNILWSPNPVMNVLPAPDIAINDVQFEAGSHMPRIRWTGLGLGMDLQVTMSNAGRADADIVRWRPWLSRDNVLSQDDICLFTLENQVAQPSSDYYRPGDTKITSFEAFVPIGTAAGDYFLIVDAVHKDYEDPNVDEPGRPRTGQVYAADENLDNNLWCSPARNITVTEPEAYVTWLDASVSRIGSAYDSYDYNYTVNVANLGGDYSAQVLVEVYVTENPSDSELTPARLVTTQAFHLAQIGVPVTLNGQFASFHRKPAWYVGIRLIEGGRTSTTWWSGPTVWTFTGPFTM